jgi:hypothetical protein
LNRIVPQQPQPPSAFPVSRLRSRVDAAHVPLEGSYIALTETPLPALLEGREDIPPRKLIDRIGTKVKQESDLARVQKDVVLVGHGGQDEGFLIKNGASFLYLLE